MGHHHIVIGKGCSCGHVKQVILIKLAILLLHEKFKTIQSPISSLWDRCNIVKMENACHGYCHQPCKGMMWGWWKSLLGSKVRHCIDSTKITHNFQEVAKLENEFYLDDQAAQ